MVETTFYALEVFDFIQGQINGPYRLSPAHGLKRSRVLLDETLRRVVITPEIAAARENLLGAMTAYFAACGDLFCSQADVDEHKAKALKSWENLRGLIAKAERSDYDRQNRPAGPDMAIQG
jgi:hypothetical protein